MQNLISLIYIIKDAADFNIKIKGLAKNLDAINYPKDRFEAIFIINSFGSGKKLTDSLPLVKLYYVRHINVEHYNCAIKNALGNILVFVNGAHIFQPNDLKEINQFIADKSVWVNSRWVAVMKGWIVLLPIDLFCLGTFLTLNMPHPLNNEQFHRKEILRYMYKLNQRDFKYKIWLFGKYLRGKI